MNVVPDALSRKKYTKKAQESWKPITPEKKKITLKPYHEDDPYENYTTFNMTGRGIRKGILNVKPMLPADPQGIKAR